MKDPSNGYEALAATFIAGRAASNVGVAMVRDWCRRLHFGSAILDLGCGCGVPISQILIEQGFDVYGVDASARMTRAFRARFPQAVVACEAVEESDFFGRQFDGVVSWGLFFLLPVAAQLTLIHKVAAALAPGGRFLFTSPAQVCTWRDILTGHLSQSPGAEIYRATLTAADFTLLDEYDDEGKNHYYDAVKR
jgi:2-polyprenyl-3-methyl-5-hydroxy-6-metoxy-1,4-benzoquinol methylase